MTGESELRQEIVTVCHQLRQASLVVALEGNVSSRYCQGEGPDVVLATPTMMDKALLSSADLARTDTSGNPLDDGPRASSELPMHLAIYRVRPDVCGIVHAHPPYATSFAVAGIPLDKPLLAEAVVDLGAVPVAPYGQPGQAGLAESIAALAESRHDVILMANHGAVTLGRSVTEAMHRMETLEHYAQIAILTRILGRSTSLSTSQVSALIQDRDQRSVPEASCPVCDLNGGSHVHPDRYVFTHDELVALLEEAVGSIKR